jgi:D-3-phosphoglycerate dehydrogenase
VVGTHHIGASTHQAQESISEGTIEVILAFLAGRVINCVNLAPEGGAGVSRVTVRHLDRVGVLAHVFDLLRASGLNVQNMQNQIFAGGNAAVATVHIDGLPSPELLAALRATEHVLSVNAAQNGSQG